MFRIFRKKKQEVVVEKTTKSIVFHDFNDTSDEILTKLATHIINEEPVIANLESLDIDSANKAIAFLSGVVYAIDGEITNIREKIFMFGHKTVYEDGSMKDFIDQL